MTQTRTKQRVSFPSAELPEGTATTITVGRREIAVFNDGGELYAVFNRCPHSQAPLSRGRVAGAPAAGPVGHFEFAQDVRVIRCPWHHYEFDLSSGRCLVEPERFRVASYEVRAEGDEIAVYI